MAPGQGKWWNENEGRWVYTDMKEEAKKIENVPKDDKDLLGEVEAELDAKAELGKGDSKDVADTFYYDVLDVSPSADESTIRRRYYLLARKYHPDKNPDDKEAAEKFKDIAEAYQVLSDPQLRDRYNKVGKDGLSPDKTSAADGGMAKVDPTILFAFLFGSDRFNDYVGRLAAATSAAVGDSPKISVQDARKLQQRRVTRLAIKLIEKIQPWTDVQKEGNAELLSSIEAEWKREAESLCTASYGFQLVSTIGKLYNLLAIQYQGSMNSGQGLPSIAKWAERQKASMDKKSYVNSTKMETLRAGLDMLKIQQELKMKMEQSQSADERDKIAKEMEEASGKLDPLLVMYVGFGFGGSFAHTALTFVLAVGIMLRVMWTTTVVDITSTIYEVAHCVFFDQSVDKEVRMARSEAVKKLGEIWMSVPEPKGQSDEEKDAKKLYEEAAFAAMLETVKRKDASQA